MKKHKLLIFSLISILGFSLVGCTNNNKVNKNTEKEIHSIIEVDNTKTDNIKKEENNKVYKLNEVGKSGNYQLKTLGYNEVIKIKGTSKNFITDNKYVVVDIEIAANDATLESGYSADDFLLVDNNKKTYSAESTITNHLNVKNEHDDDSYIGIYKPLNPNVFKKTQIVFEVPKDTEPELIKNKNSGSKSYVQFNLK
ncbi:DUF4352 domain-containing protein [Clostridium botulinum]|uniref:Lipoprotein n=1 Tax=Clostridium botulinum (strain Eklund 17B / Type B) TaxID=935198 RepID=B2TNV4_CLOBB|nr:putative lipoprotein [Clostridium botulinum B str. Eklund 17B (NRP)]MBY6976224.1 DUF4352 domain-containing protein [Clostridium botulinum]MBY7000649.1 DUF4352 domain-containing protein [Clostridium botulinum]MCR1273413.1 DUF4352 domain-containing protein [Clostridium botulinum]NFD71327.1 DUF4352 domain-containing protein [Clostridium botulinum]